MTDDLIARLRDASAKWKDAHLNVASPLFGEAADEIEKLIVLARANNDLACHEANGRRELQSEISSLRLDLEAKDCLMDSQYIAGVKMGWNLCATEDEAGYAKITGNTEHIAELKRVRSLRSEVGS